MKNTIRISLNGSEKGQSFLQSVLKARIANASAAKATTQQKKAA